MREPNLFWVEDDVHFRPRAVIGRTGLTSRRLGAELLKDFAGLLGGYVPASDGDCNTLKTLRPMQYCVRSCRTAARSSVGMIRP